MIYDYRRVPSELKEEKRWVLWRKKRDNKGRITKIPVNAMTGYGAKSNDPTTWTTFEEALSQCDRQGCSGLGFMLGDGIFGVDLDNHIDENGNLETPVEEFNETANEFINALNSYTEFSQSGNGIHIICKGHLPSGARKKGSFEMYDKARFFAMTGNQVENTSNTIEDRTEEIKALHKKYLGSKEEQKVVYVKKSYNTVSTSVLNDDEVISKASSSRQGSVFTTLYQGQWQGLYPSQSEADLSFCNMLAFWTGKDFAQMDRIFRSSGLYREKWDILRGDNTYGEMTISTAISKCQNVYTPQIKEETTHGKYSFKTKKYELDDTGNANRFIDRFGDSLKYNFDNKTWMIFDGKTWVRDTKQLVKTQCDLLIEEMRQEMFRETEDDERRKAMVKNIKHLSSSSGKEAMLKEAMHVGNTPVENRDFNQNNYLLNCGNGIVDLKTGNIYQHDKKQMLSKNTNVDIDMEHEPKKWLKFLSEIFGGSQDMVDYVQKAVGYTLTGDTKEQCFFQCYGDGANGKSVFLDIIYKILGSYALNSQVESILAKSGNNGGASSEIARMDGARFIRTNEPNENSRFNEGLIKQLVSGDVTTARYLYGAEFEFIPIFKLWIATNYTIEVRGTDHGIWRRMRIIPFKQKFEGAKMDRNLESKLIEELPQVLGWAVKGCLKWQQEGLNIPSEIKEETESYRNEMDIVAKFIKECTRKKEGAKEKAGDVFKEYSQWSKDGHEYCMTQTKFGIEMKKRFDKTVSGGYSYYKGFILKKHDTSFVYTRKGK